MREKRQKLTVGWRETVSLPQLNLIDVPVKIDTGARTSALHATDIELYDEEGAAWARFAVNHPSFHGSSHHRLPVHHVRSITNTSGVAEQRIVVRTTIGIGANEASVEVSLSNRADMKYPMIVGRTALRVLGLLVNPTRSWLQSAKPKN